MGAARACPTVRGDMGRIAEAGDVFALPVNDTYRNKVDDILERLDDEDRAIVLAWLRDPDVGEEDIEFRFKTFQIRCSDSTVRRWRRMQRNGTGFSWG